MIKKNRLIVIIQFAISASLYGAAEPQTQSVSWNELPAPALESIGQCSADRDLLNVAKGCRQFARILQPELRKRGELLNYWKHSIKRVLYAPTTIDWRICFATFVPHTELIATPEKVGFTLRSAQTGNVVGGPFTSGKSSQSLICLPSDPKKLQLIEITSKHVHTWQITKEKESEKYAAIVINSRKIPTCESLVAGVAPDIIIAIAPNTTLAAAPAKAVMDPYAKNMVYIWAPGNYKEPCCCEQFPEIVTALAFPSNDKLVAVGTLKGDVYLWNWQTNKKTIMPIVFKGCEVSSLLFSSDQQYIAATYASWTNGVCGGFDVWEVRTREILIHNQSGDTYGALSFSPDNRILAVKHQDDGTVTLTNLVSKRQINQISAHIKFEDMIGSRQPVFSPDGKSIATMSLSGVFELWTPELT